MLTPKEHARGLNRREDHLPILRSLIQSASTGIDCAEAAPEVVKYCVTSSAARDPTILSAALDVLVACPNHSQWSGVVDALGSAVADTSTDAAVVEVVMAKVPVLPFVVCQALLASADFPFAPAVEGIVKESKKSKTRRASIHAALSLVLRERPLTEVPDRLGATIDLPQLQTYPLPDDTFTRIRVAIERLVLHIMEAMFDKDDAIAVMALSRVVAFVTNASRSPGGPVATAKRALASTLAEMTVSNARNLSGRMIEVKTSRQLRLRAIKAVSAAAEWVLTPRMTMIGATLDEDQVAKATEWAVSWTNKFLMHALDDKDVLGALTAAKCLMSITAVVDSHEHQDNYGRWGTAALTRTLAVLEQSDGNHSLAQKSSAVRLCLTTLLAMVRSGGCAAKLVSTSSARLLPFVARLPRSSERLGGFQILGRVVLSYDLQNREADLASVLSSFLGSQSVSSLMTTNDGDSPAGREFVTCICNSVLEATDLILAERSELDRSYKADLWNGMVSRMVLKFTSVLAWPKGPSFLLATEAYLKLFETLGQYTTRAALERNMTLEEYEKAQEILVRVGLNSEDVFIRSALLLTNTHYWIESGLKAEANAGHILKTSWLHLQGTYRDSEQALTLLEEGTAWGTSSSSQGYVSTLALDNAVVGAMSALELTRRIPRAADKVASTLLWYLELLDRSIVYNAMTQTIVESAYFGVLMFKDEHFPSDKPLRTAWPRPPQQQFGWIQGIRDGCTVPTFQSGARQQEEIEAFLEQDVIDSSPANEHRKNEKTESVSQTLSGSSDPFSISAYHSLDREKGTVHVSLFLQNRTEHAAEDVLLDWQFGLGVQPLPGVPLSRSIGTIGPDSRRFAEASALVAPDDTGIGRLIVVLRFKSTKKPKSLFTFSSLPYLFPSSDILMLGKAANGTGMSTFRRRWDYLDREARLVVLLSSGQSVDLLVDILERRSPFRCVGRMTAHTQLVAMTADSTVSKHVAVMIHVPEASGREGQGPAGAHVSVRTAVEAHSLALVSEIRQWLKHGNFRCVAPEDESTYHPSTMSFVRSGQGSDNLRRWRIAQRARLSF